jgi:hypothetical protein
LPATPPRRWREQHGFRFAVFAAALLTVVVTFAADAPVRPIWRGVSHRGCGSGDLTVTPRQEVWIAASGPPAGSDSLANAVQLLRVGSATPAGEAVAPPGPVFAGGEPRLATLADGALVLVLHEPAGSGVTRTTARRGSADARTWSPAVVIATYADSLDPSFGTVARTRSGTLLLPK